MNILESVFTNLYCSFLVNKEQAGTNEARFCNKLCFISVID